jgi:hypothetical protein
MTIKVPAMGDMTTHTEQKIGAILTLVEEVEKRLSYGNQTDPLL